MLTKIVLPPKSLTTVRSLTVIINLNTVFYTVPLVKSVAIGDLVNKTQHFMSI